MSRKHFEANAEELAERVQTRRQFEQIITLLEGGDGNYELVDISINELCQMNLRGTPLELAIIVSSFNSQKTQQNILTPGNSFDRTGHDLEAWNLLFVLPRYPCTMTESTYWTIILVKSAEMRPHVGRCYRPSHNKVTRVYSLII